METVGLHEKVAVFVSPRAGGQGPQDVCSASDAAIIAASEAFVSNSSSGSGALKPFFEVLKMRVAGTGTAGPLSVDGLWRIGRVAELTWCTRKGPEERLSLERNLHPQAPLYSATDKAESSNKTTTSTTVAPIVFAAVVLEGGAAAVTVCLPLVTGVVCPITPALERVLAGSMSCHCATDDLPSPHAAALLLALEGRFQRPQPAPYTLLDRGCLISINPHQTITEPSLRTLAAGDTTLALPGPRAVGRRAVEVLRAATRHAAVIVTGRSGAGKTVATNLVLSELSFACGGESAGPAGSSGAQAGLLRRLLDAAPALEAFGNASTSHNKNSSRFVRVVSVFVSAAEKVVGAGVRAHLLETTRVVARGALEGPFHIFSLLCAQGGLSHDQRVRLDVWDASLFRCLGSQPLPPAPWSMAEVRASLAAVGFAPAEVELLWSTLAAILHLLNVQFDADDVYSPATVRAGDKHVCEHVASLLRLEGGGLALESLLTTVTLGVGGGSVRRQLHTAAAVAARDTLAKALYQGAFDWVVARINAACSGAASAAAGSPASPSEGTSADTPTSASAPPAVPKAKSLIAKALEAVTRSRDADGGDIPEVAVQGDKAVVVLPFYVPAEDDKELLLLDIFGFEQFEQHDNGLEQFLINYANESVQQLYVDATLAAMQTELRCEGITDLPGTATLTPPERSPCLRALYGQGRSNVGLLAMMGDEGILAQAMRGADGGATLAARLSQQGGEAVRAHPHKPNAFVLRHFCGEVTYSTADFAAKNRIQRDVFDAAIASSEPESVLRTLQTATNAVATANAARSGLVKPSQAAERRSQVASFQADVDALLATLRQGPILWVRCIQSVVPPRPGFFDQSLVSQQLAESGVYRSFAALQTGYAIRMALPDFARNVIQPLLRITGPRCLAAKDLAEFNRLLEQCQFSELSSKLTARRVGGVHSSALEMLARSHPEPDTRNSALTAGHSHGPRLMSPDDQASDGAQGSLRPTNVPAQPLAVAVGASMVFLTTQANAELIAATGAAAHLAARRLQSAGRGYATRRAAAAGYVELQRSRAVAALVQRMRDEEPVRAALEAQRGALLAADTTERHRFFTIDVAAAESRAAKVQAKMAEVIASIGAEVGRALRELRALETTRREREGALRAALEAEERTAEARLSERREQLQRAEEFARRRDLREQREAAARQAAEDRKPLSTRREEEIIEHMKRNHSTRIRAEKEAVLRFSKELAKKAASDADVAVSKHVHRCVERLTTDARRRDEQLEQHALAEKLLLEHAIADMGRRLERERRQQQLLQHRAAASAQSAVTAHTISVDDKSGLVRDVAYSTGVHAMTAALPTMRFGRSAPAGLGDRLTSLGRDEGCDGGALSPTAARVADIRRRRLEGLSQGHLAGDPKASPPIKPALLLHARAAHADPSHRGPIPAEWMDASVQLLRADASGEQWSQQQQLWALSIER